MTPGTAHSHGRDLPPLPGPGWAEALAEAEPARHAAWENVSGVLSQLCPRPERVFHAFDRGFADVRVVILGQDPYPTAGQATGLAFAVPPEVATPPTLRNILAELRDDAIASGWVDPAPDNGPHAQLVRTDLEHWASQGVLLLNSVLTCRVGESLAHERVGWQMFTAQVLRALCARKTPPVAVLWGRHAQALGRGLPWLATVESSHPSPLSARRGFFGSRPFSNVNAVLASQGQPPVQWIQPERAPHS